MSEDNAKRLETLLTETFGIGPAYHHDLKNRLLLTFVEALAKGATITTENDPMGKRVIITREGQPERSIGFYAIPERFN